MPTQNVGSCICHLPRGTAIHQQPHALLQSTLNLTRRCGRIKICSCTSVLALPDTRNVGLLTLGAHAQRGFVSLSVCVCRRLFWHYTGWRMSDTNGFITTRTWKLIRRFPWNDCVREICCEKANCIIALGLPVTWSALPWWLRKSQRMACIACRMLSTTVASQCQTLRELY